jgi:hypothetical protein
MAQNLLIHKVHCVYKVFASTMRVSSLESPKPSMPGRAWAEEQCLFVVSPSHTLEKIPYTGETLSEQCVW